jgi:TPP-dependent pyruvate/acetoin dehydrogenase alpha subunit
MERDPLTIARRRLIELGLPEGELDTIEREARETIERAVEGALQSPYPDPAAKPGTEFRP